MPFGFLAMWLIMGALALLLVALLYGIARQLRQQRADRPEPRADRAVDEQPAEGSAASPTLFTPPPQRRREFGKAA